jgi:hypothetical protein
MKLKPLKSLEIEKKTHFSRFSLSSSKLSCWKNVLILFLELLNFYKIKSQMALEL